MAGFKHILLVLKDETFDKTNAASQTAQALGTKHENIILSDKAIFNQLDSFFNAMDEPFADSSSINVFHLCRTVKKALPLP